VPAGDAFSAVEALLGRRSIRSYEQRPIPEELVQRLLEAAMSAPSAGNQQPWQFVVVNDRRLLERVPSVHPYADMVPSAPLAVMVCGDLTLDTHTGYWVQDCSAATENLLVAAYALGLGAVWLGCYPREERVVGLRSLLGLPEHIVPLALVPIGYPAETKPPAGRFQPSRVHWNGW
jgi:nitroreductase